MLGKPMNKEVSLDQKEANIRIVNGLQMQPNILINIV